MIVFSETEDTITVSKEDFDDLVKSDKLLKKMFECGTENTKEYKIAWALMKQKEIMNVSDFSSSRSNNRSNTQD